MFLNGLLTHGSRRGLLSSTTPWLADSDSDSSFPKTAEFFLQQTADAVPGQIDGSRADTKRLPHLGDRPLLDHMKMEDRVVLRPGLSFDPAQRRTRYFRI